MVEGCSEDNDRNKMGYNARYDFMLNKKPCKSLVCHMFCNTYSH